MQHRLAIRGYPIEVLLAQPERGFGNISFQHDRPHQPAPQFALPVGHGRFDSLRGRLPACGADHNGQGNVGQRQIAQQIAAQEAGGAG